jgi:hypothetical protein
MIEMAREFRAKKKPAAGAKMPRGFVGNAPEKARL